MSPVAEHSSKSPSDQCVIAHPHVRDRKSFAAGHPQSVGMSAGRS